MEPTTGRLDGKTVIITGATRGLGETTARQMAAEGAQVVLTGRADDRGQALARELGTGAMYTHCDVTSEDEIAAVIDLAVDRYGRLDCIFNNAGVVGASGPIEGLTVEDYETVMTTLLRSVFLGMKHAARVMKPQGSGVILSTTSIAGVDGGWGPHLYAAAKAGIIGLTRNVATELGTWGVRVVAIAPGKMLTPLVAERLVGDPNDLAGGALALQSRSPIQGRVGLSEDVAHAAVWLASDEAGFVSGTTITVDGGLTTGSRENLTTDQLGSWARRGVDA